MAIVAHVAENNIKAGVCGGYRHGEDNGVLVDGDLTSEAAALAAVDTDVANLHSAEKLVGLRVKAAIRQGANYLSTANTGSDVSAVYDLLPTVRGRSLAL
jgi:hypothetical protein